MGSFLITGYSLQKVLLIYITFFLNKLLSLVSKWTNIFTKNSPTLMKESLPNRCYKKHHLGYIYINYEEPLQSSNLAPLAIYTITELIPFGYIYKTWEATEH